jgi:trehalose 6-phosphate synthase/phosphatase
LRKVLSSLRDVAMVYVISGRSASTLDAWLGDLGIGLVCEHVLAIRHPGCAWSEAPVSSSRALDEIVEPVFREFTERTPGSRIERKAASLAWHYRGSDPKLGVWRAKELLNLLEGRLSNDPYTVLWGSKVIEVRHLQVTKGHAARQILERFPESGVVVCAGNDRTDEDMFSEVIDSEREPHVVVHVGSVNTSAEFVVETPSELLTALETMVEAWRPSVPDGANG